MQSLPMDGESLAVLAEYGLGEARLSGCHLRRYEAGEAMARQNEAMDALLFVRSGNAKVCINARNGRHLIICYYISSGILGVVELLTEAQAMDTVTALSQVDCVAVPMERNREALLGCLPFVLRMGQEVSAKLKYSSRAHTVSALYTSEERLCSYLLMAERDGIVREYLTEVAQSVGVSYRHVFRILGELCREGILERTEAGFRILDRERLRQRSCEAE